MKTLLTFLFILATLQPGQSPEEMYAQYDKDGQYQAMQEQMDEVTQKSEAAEQEKSDKKTYFSCYVLNRRTSTVKNRKDSPAMHYRTKEENGEPDTPITVFEKLRK